MSFYRRSSYCSASAAPSADVGSNRATVQRYGGRTPLPHAPRLAFYTRPAYGDPITDAILKAAKAGVDAGNGGSADPSVPPPAGTSSGVSLTKILGGGAALAAALWWWKR